jgi:hypothetical protein
MKKIILFLATLAGLLSFGGCFFPDHGGMDHHNGRDEQRHDGHRDDHHEDHHDNN